MAERQARVKIHNKCQQLSSQLYSSGNREAKLCKVDADMRVLCSRLQAEVNIHKDSEMSLIVDRERIGKELDNLQVASQLKASA